MKSMIKFVLAVLVLTALFCGVSTPVNVSKQKGFDSLAQTGMPLPKPLKPSGARS